MSAQEHVSDTSATVVNINKEEKKTEEKSELTDEVIQKDQIARHESETLGEEHTTVDVMSMSEEAKEEEETKKETKEETKDDSSCYFFEEGTENTCFICADLPPGK